MISQNPIVVIGAGLAGLTAARYLREHGHAVRVFEASKNIGGLCRSEFDEDGFTYDCGAHFINSRLAAALGISSLCRPMPNYEEVFWFRGQGYKYPVDLLTSPRFVLSALCGRADSLVRPKAINVAEALRRSMGRAIADNLALPLIEAWSGARCDELSPAIVEKFSTSAWQAMFLSLASRFSDKTVAVGYSHEVPESPHVFFVYPDGGIGGVCELLAKGNEDVISTESKVDRIGVEGERVSGVEVDGEWIPAAAVINTAPLPILARMIDGTDKLDHLAKFKYRPMIFVNLKFDLPEVMGQVVTWTPDSEFLFFRVSDIGRALPWLVPEGKNQITCDIGCEISDETWNSRPEQLAERCLEQVGRIVPGVAKHYLGFHVRRTPCAYPVFLTHYEEARRAWERGTGIRGLSSVGRNGEFKHILMEDVYWRTRSRCRSLLSEIADERSCGRLGRSDDE